MATRRAATQRKRRATERSAGPRSLKILVLSGPNLDRLGRREPAIYGSTTLSQIHERLASEAAARGASAVCRQSNHEGDLVTWIGAAGDDGFAGILINPGALTHTSYALYDAIKGVGLPTVEVHISNPDAREPFRRRSRVAPVVLGRIAGFGPSSYSLALAGLLDKLEGN